MNHILLTNQRPNRPVVNPEHLTADTLCGRDASGNDVEFAAAKHQVQCADCARIYGHPDFARMRARS